MAYSVSMCAVLVLAAMQQGAGVLDLASTRHLTDDDTDHDGVA